MTSFVLPAVVLVVVAFIIKLLWTGLVSPVSKLPGPWYSKYTGIVLRFYTLSGRRIFYVDDLHHRYGGVIRVSPTEAAVADIKGVAQIHKIGGGFLKSSFYDKITPDGNPGIFAMQDPHAHAARRRLFARAFSNTSLKANWGEDVRMKADLLIQQIKKAATSQDKGADVFFWFTLYTTDVIAHLSFGESFNMLELGKQTPYIDALQTAMLAGILKSELPIVFEILRRVPLQGPRKLTRAPETVMEYGGNAINTMKNATGNVTNLFGQMLAASEGEEKERVTLRDEDVKNEAGNLIVAGSDTTAVTLTYLVWAVLKQPELQAQLEGEVNELSSELTVTELEAAPLLNSVIEETLRLYGAAPGALPRVVPKQGINVAGYHIPAGVEVSTQAYTNNRDPQLFPDPLRFDGLRFVQKSTLTAEQKAAFLPFGGGSRVCLGLHLAYIELRLAAAMFFRECRGARISDSMTDDMMELENHFLIAPKAHCCYVTLR